MRFAYCDMCGKEILTFHPLQPQIGMKLWQVTITSNPTVVQGNIQQIGEICDNCRVKLEQLMKAMPIPEKTLAINHKEETSEVSKQ